MNILRQIINAAQQPVLKKSNIIFSKLFNYYFSVDLFRPVL